MTYIFSYLTSLLYKCLPVPCCNCLSLFCCSCLCCQCNCLIFPAPQANSDDSDHSEIAPCHVWKQSTARASGNKSISVPEVEISFQQSSRRDTCLLFFHGNAEDLTQSSTLVTRMVEQCSLSLIAMEYPTYSKYKSYPALISDHINQDALNVYDELSSRYNNIVVIGRSIGTGPACYVAGRRNPQKLILISPYDSIRNTAKDMVGCCLAMCLKNHFDNITSLSDFTGKMLVIHGKRDEVIAYDRGRSLVEAMERQGRCTITFKSPPEMSHNRFNLERDIISPVVAFISE